MDEKNYLDVLDYWFRELTPKDWFVSGDKHDQQVRERFGTLFDKVSRGQCDKWKSSSRGRLALIIVLDQFPRHIFRAQGKAFETDTIAQKLTLEGIECGADKLLNFSEKHFFYMPLMHAEDKVLQAKSVEMFNGLVEEAQLIAQMASEHADTINKYNRFPYRNSALDRPSTDEEREFLIVQKLQYGP